MPIHSTVIAPSWWSIQDTPAVRLLRLLLMSRADRDGVVQLDSLALSETVGTDRREIVRLVAHLSATNRLITYQTAAGVWAWLPEVSETQPSRGALKRPRDSSLPPPPKDAVRSLLAALWGREPTTEDCRRACPRAWGRVAAAAGASIPDEDVNAVWEGWRDRQVKPGACRLGGAITTLIQSALGESSPEQLIALIAYAYDSDEAGPRFWRGENGNGRTYLGLDNLLVAKKLQGRLQLVSVWLETCGARVEDGTDLGPLAAYRRKGPRGTASTPDPRPKRLSDQCRKILALLTDRGPDGARTSELAGIALKYTGRLSEIRGAGHDVVLTERSSNGNNLYVLVGGSDGMD
jgi:hypothetical protein